MIRLFQAQPLAVNDTLELDPDSTHRLLSVLRVENNQSIILFNNDGFEYFSEINIINKKRVQVRILEKKVRNNESNLDIHLGQVIAKGEKMDFIIQKATELGVKTISPLFSNRSIVHLKDERLTKKQEHWQKVAIHAAEQCGRTKVPVVSTPVPLEHWITHLTAKTRLYLDPHSSETLNTVLIEDNLALLIGPEGGFSEQENDFIRARGFSAVRLGPRILRTETAALVAISAIQYKIGDLA